VVQFSTAARDVQTCPVAQLPTYSMHEKYLSHETEYGNSPYIMLMFRMRGALPPLLQCFNGSYGN
jgi:hypothetical protein